MELTSGTPGSSEQGAARLLRREKLLRHSEPVLPNPTSNKVDSQLGVSGLGESGDNEPDPGLISMASTTNRSNAGADRQ